MKEFVRFCLLKLGFKKFKRAFFTKDYHEFSKYDVGEYTYGYPKLLFQNDEAKLSIGKFCSIAQDVKIFLGGNHRVDWISTYPFSEVEMFKNVSSAVKGHPSTKGDVLIGNDVWIGFGVVILSGVKIGNGAVIGTNAVIAKDIGPYEIWVGNPARMVKKRFSDEHISMLEDMQWWNWELEKIKQNIDTICSNNINFFNDIHFKENKAKL